MAKPMARARKRKPAKGERRRRPARRSGGRQASSARLTRFGNLLLDHARVLLASLGRLAGQPLSTVMTVAVIGIALALPAGLQLLVANGRALSGHWEGAAELSVYLRPDVELAVAEELAEGLRADAAIAGIQLIPADAALEEFREHSGFGDALDALPENPLPHVIVVLPAPDRQSPGLAGRLPE